MTFPGPLFRKLLLSSLLLIAVTLLVLDFYLSRYTAGRQEENVTQQLEAEAHILSGELGSVAVSQLENWSQGAGERARARVTLIEPGGVVLADSQHDPETMENHAHRPEIREAKEKGRGKSIRHSATLNRDLCYVAILVSYQNKPGTALRLAVPLEDLDADVAAVRRRILGASVVAALVALAVAFVFSRSFTRRINDLRAFAERLVDPRASRSRITEGSDELGELGQSLNRMAAQLRELVGRLGEESARREAILSSMVEGVLAVDNELRVQFCNDSFARSVGFQGSIPERLPLLELVRDPSFLEMIKRVVASGETLKQRLQLAPGAVRTFEVQAAPLAGPARLGAGAIALLHDITDLERLERVRKDFVANVSHELRTPLTAVRGYAETLLEGGLEDREHNRRFVEIIHAHAIRLNNIASDLLTLSELESGVSGPEMERISIRPVVESALRAVEPEASSRGVRLISVEVGDAEVLGERRRLEQALVNLLDNAIKFNHRGGEVRVEAEKAAGGSVTVAISDNGIGIPSQDLPRIFERFYRVDKARSREVGGTGLGLSIVKHIIERMNGTVTVESQLTKGSKFVISLSAV